MRSSFQIKCKKTCLQCNCRQLFIPGVWGHKAGIISQDYIGIKGPGLPRFLPHTVTYSASVDLESSLPLSQSWGTRLPSEHRLKNQCCNLLASQMTHSALENVLCLKHRAAPRLCLRSCFSSGQQRSSEVNPLLVSIYQTVLSITAWFLRTQRGSLSKETT